MNKIKVRIINETAPCWYKVGQIHEVNNYITFDYSLDDTKAFFEKSKGYYGILVSDCVILNPEKEIPEYTMDELYEKIGHKFKIKNY